jgi:hypothetical protein
VQSAAESRLGGSSQVIRAADFISSATQAGANAILALRLSVIRPGGIMMHRLLVVVAVASLLAVGCNTPGSRLNAPPHGRAYTTSDMQGTFTYMADNALLADMTVNDSHFLPHRALLNDLGQRRLARLASLMEAYGGTIRFDTALTDEDLIEHRVTAVMDFLCEAGIDTTQEVVKRDMPGGEGMSAAEAILIKANEGTYDPEKQRPQSSATGSMTAK